MPRGRNSKGRVFALLKRAITDTPSLTGCWDVGDINQFSPDIRLYDYQVNAVRSAVCALRLFYGDNGDQSPDSCRARFAEALSKTARKIGHERMEAIVAPEDIKPVRRNPLENEKLADNAFRILAEGLKINGEEIPFEQIINRAGFWMATGSGKTLVMIKIVDCLLKLMDSGAIPKREIMLLASSDRHLDQYRRAADAFNQNGSHQIALVDLPQFLEGQMRLERSVYFSPGHLVTNSRGEKTMDWRDYDIPDGGGWYILQDEAHKGDSEDSNLRAVKSVLARNGFLFNFSASFTDPQDILTTAYEFGLCDFLHAGYGKNIFVSPTPIASADDKASTLRSLIALGYAKKEVAEIRKQTKEPRSYHEPLMLTVAHKSTKLSSELHSFFGVLAGLAAENSWTQSKFDEIKEALCLELKTGKFLFDGEKGSASTLSLSLLNDLTLTELRKLIFGTGEPSQWEIVMSSEGLKDNREMAIKLKGSDNCFALLLIGDNREWIQNAVSKEVSITESLADASFFAELESKPEISILMGSRMFAESWDTVRPNVINFINLGTDKTSRKFVVQTAGRGVRIRPFPSDAITGNVEKHDSLDTKSIRRRIEKISSDILPNEKWKELQTRNLAPETLFVFGTRPDAIQAILSQQASPSDENWVSVGDCFETKKAPDSIPLLVPQYERQSAPPSDVSSRIKMEIDGALGAHMAKMEPSMLVTLFGAMPEEIAGIQSVFENTDVTPAEEGGNNELFWVRTERAISQIRKLSYDHKFHCVAPLNHDENIGHVIHFVNFRVNKKYETEFRNAAKKVKLPWSLTKIEILDKKQEFIEMAKKQLITPEEADKAIKETDFTQYVSDILALDGIAEHYYSPLVRTKNNGNSRLIENEIANYAIANKSELDFLKELTDQLSSVGNDWDGWMFSRLAEQKDNVWIPLSAGRGKFYPDFVFWMWRADKDGNGGEYHIVFVDPKGTAHADWQHKCDGYLNIFTDKQKLRTFSWSKKGEREWRVHVCLLLYNKPEDVGKLYRPFWKNKPKEIFSCHLDMYKTED